MNSPAVRNRLQEYLKNLALGIEQGHRTAGVTFQITSEIDLERFIRVGSEGDGTLLSLLGYAEADIDDHVSIFIGTNKVTPDYVIRCGQKTPLAVLELKRPDENVDSRDFLGQLDSYCHALEAPIGILFNGRDLRLYINTRLRYLSTYPQSFSKEPVGSANRSNPQRVAELLGKFFSDSFRSNSARVARKLAQDHIELIRKRERQEKIRAILLQYLVFPQPANAEEVVAALAGVDNLWNVVDFSEKPTATELVTAWNITSLPSGPSVEPPRRIGINPELRKKVVEVCEKRGWIVIERAQIRGLNYRVDGVEDKGYHKVSGGINVPSGLCIQGKSRPDATRIIQELDKLLSIDF